MAVPKHKASKKQSATRYSQFKICKPSIGECPQCHEQKPNHRVCPNCGYYDGVKRVDVQQEQE